MGRERERETCIVGSVSAAETSEPAMVWVGREERGREKETYSAGSVAAAEKFMLTMVWVWWEKREREREGESKRERGREGERERKRDLQYRQCGSCRDVRANDGVIMVGRERERE